MPFLHQRGLVHLFHDLPDFRGIISPIATAHCGSPPLIISSGNWN